MENKTYTCIVCPEGCSVSVSSENGDIRISGNKCRRGEKYVLQESTNPMRNISSTVPVSGGKANLVPVKTATPIPKSRIFDVMAEIRRVSAEAPVQAGQVLIENVAGTGSNIVATASVSKAE